MVSSDIAHSQNLKPHRNLKKSKFRISRTFKILIALNVTVIFMVASESAAGNPATPENATGSSNTAILLAQTDSQNGESTTSQASSPNSQAARVHLEGLSNSRVINLYKIEIGEIEDVVTNEQGQFLGVVVRLTNRLAVASKTVFVSAAEIELTGQVVIWRTHMSGDELDALPDYDDDLVSRSGY